MFQLLKGIRIIDATTVVLGPYATRLLGDLGADVIKIEPPEGDVFRAVRPGRSDRMGAGFLNCNRNKRSLVLDLKQAEGRAALLEVVRDADVVVHNMRPKSAEKLGLSYQQLRACNDRLVYCYSPGFGQGGRHAGLPAYDDIIQAMSGLAALNADSNGEPRFLPTIVCDKVGGLHLALAVLAGVAHRQISGQGCCIEVPMFESMVSFLMAEQLAGETFVPALGRTGYERLLSPYRKPFRTRDGYVTILPYTTSHWRSFLKMIGRAELAEEAWVKDPAARSARVNDLYKVIAEVNAAADHRRMDFGAGAGRRTVCASGQRGRSAQRRSSARCEFLCRGTASHAGAIRVSRAPFRVEGVGSAARQACARARRNTRAVLAEAGLTAEQIDKLVALGVIRNERTVEGT